MDLHPYISEGTPGESVAGEVTQWRSGIVAGLLMWLSGSACGHEFFFYGAGVEGGVGWSHLSGPGVLYGMAGSVLFFVLSRLVVSPAGIRPVAWCLGFGITLVLGIPRSVGGYFLAEDCREGGARPCVALANLRDWSPVERDEVEWLLVDACAAGWQVACDYAERHDWLRCDDALFVFSQVQRDCAPAPGGDLFWASDQLKIASEHWGVGPDWSRH